MINIYEQLNIPEERKIVSITEKEGEFIYDFLKQNKIKKTLEVGLAFGASAVYIISATKSQHYAIDPYQNTFFDLGINNLEKLKLIKFLKLEKDFSYNALPELLKEGLKIDFAFVDGSHQFDNIFIDFFYIDKMLNQNGFVLFDDAWMRSTQHVFSWIKKNKKNYKILETPIKNFLLVQKIGDDKREWYEFKSFCTMKSFFSNLIFKLKNK